MPNVPQNNPSYLLLSVYLILGGVLTAFGMLPGTITLMCGLLAGLMMIYDTYSASRAGVKHLKRGVPLLGMWLMLASVAWFIPAAGMLGVAAPFLGLAAGGMLLLEEYKNNNKGLLLTIGWVMATSLATLTGFAGGIPSIILAVLGIAAGYFLIQDK